MDGQGVSEGSEGSEPTTAPELSWINQTVGDASPEPTTAPELLWINQTVGDASSEPLTHRKAIRVHRRTISSHVMHDFQRKKSRAGIARLKSKKCSAELTSVVHD